MNEQINPQRVLPHRKPRKASIFISLLALLSVMLFAGASIQAEGSRDLVENGGYRPYIECYLGKTYYSGQNASQTVLKHRQVINVYAKEGETLFFGSSLDNAQTSGWIWHDNAYPSPTTMKDIRITTPFCGFLGFDVSSDPLVLHNGYIPDYATELKGPFQRTAILRAKGGEYHLPLADAETCHRGL